MEFQTDRISAMMFSIAEAKYVARPTRVHLPGLRECSEQAELATVILVDRAVTDVGHCVEAAASRYLEEDDVFRREFLQGILLACDDPEKLEIDEDASKSLAKLGCSWHEVIARNSILPKDPQRTLTGPVIVQNNQIHEAWRVFDDFNHAFLVSSWPSLTHEDSYENTNFAGDVYGALGIPVPSRLYFHRNPKFPLNGFRVAIKDIFDLRGLKTSVASKAYQQLYPKKEQTSEAIEDLLKLGAIIVGKTHLSSFAWREEPTQCIDFQAPFNPRGDGYISPAASSSGSGAAIASYDWLDLTIGTDTTGSGRRPALWNGSFALRPTLGSLSSVGMVPTCPEFDVPSLFTRDISLLKKVVGSWCKRYQDKENIQKPWKILYPLDYLPVDNVDQMRSIDDFTEDLASWLSTPIQKICIAEEWKRNSPKDAKNLELEDYMNNIQEHGFFYDAYHCFDGFRADYYKKYSMAPYITDPVRWLWGLARIIDRRQRELAFEKLAVFRDWFNEHILKIDQQRAIMILPIEKLEARYRDHASNWIPLVPPKGMGVLFMSPALEAPELVVPIGEFKYLSRNTHRIEHLPVAVSLLAPAETDLELIAMVEKFLSSKDRWHTSVFTGSRMWHQETKMKRSDEDATYLKCETTGAKAKVREIESSRDTDGPPPAYSTGIISMPEDIPMPRDYPHGPP